MRTNPTVHRLLCSAILLALGAGSVLGTPRQISTSGPSDSYRVGDTIDPLTFVLDRDMQVVRLVDLIRPSTALARIDHRFGNEGDFGRPERFSESFAIDPVQVE